MAISSWNAGIIRPVPVPPAGPYQDGAAPGVWTLAQVAFWNKQGLWPTAGNLAPLGLFAGGWTGSQSNVIDRVVIASAGNAIDFGDLSQSRGYMSNGGSGSSIRGVFGGGFNGSADVNTIDYVTIASAGNAIDFGDLTLANENAASCSNYVRAVWGGGNGTLTNIIAYITIASTGNAIDFGGLASQVGGCAAFASSVRGVFAGGESGTFGKINVIQYITIASTGNTTDFGDLLSERSFASGCASSTRGLVGGGVAQSGYSPNNIIEYVTIATTGNATDFGDLTVARYGTSAVASDVRGAWGGGTTGSASNVIDYVTIASTGNATDFGDLTVARYYLASCSSGAAAVQPVATPTGTIAVFGGGYLSGGALEAINLASTGNSVWFSCLFSNITYPAACSSSTRGLFIGGYSYANSASSNVISYITFASLGAPTDFGDTTSPCNYNAGLSNETRGVNALGYNGSSAVSSIDYVTIATTGNATSFGNLTLSLNRGGACASTTRGVFGFGFNAGTTSNVNVMEYITIATTGNATDFGDLLTLNRNGFAGCSNSTRGVFGGGDNGLSGGSGPTNVIQYITIASTGNATNFGDLTVKQYFPGAASSSTIATFAGGYSNPDNTNVICTITIASTGNATDFGDLVTTTTGIAGCSNAHGGL